MMTGFRHPKAKQYPDGLTCGCAKVRQRTDAAAGYIKTRRAALSSKCAAATIRIAWLAYWAITAVTQHVAAAVA